jgi:hypothetical protein
VTPALGRQFNIGALDNFFKEHAVTTNYEVIPEIAVGMITFSWVRA